MLSLDFREQFLALMEAAVAKGEIDMPRVERMMKETEPKLWKALKKVTSGI